MSSTPITAAARQLVQRFRHRELGRAPIRALLAQTDASNASSSKPTKPRASVPNPFLFQRDPSSGRWMEPRYSRRRQADLVKAAKLAGMVHLLPPGPKLRPGELAEWKKVHEEKQKKQYGIPTKKTKRNASVYAEAIKRVPRTAPHERPVKWTGRVWDRLPKGANSGARLYARKKFMFKGHPWEKVAVLRSRFIQVRLRSQKRRIKRWHASRIVNRKPFGRVRHTARLPF